MQCKCWRGTASSVRRRAGNGAREPSGTGSCPSGVRASEPDAGTHSRASPRSPAADALRSTSSELP